MPDNQVSRRAYLATTATILGSGCIGVPVEQPHSTPTGPTRHDQPGDITVSSPLNTLDEINRFPTTSHTDNIDIAPDPTGADRNVVRIHVPKNDTRGATLAYAPHETRDGSRSGETDPDSAYLRYYVYFPQNTQMYDPAEKSHGTKLPGLAGYYTQAGNGGRNADGHSWSVRTQTKVANEHQNNSAFTMNAYVYHLDQTRDDGYGDMLSWDGEYDYGQWHEVTLYVAMNTPGQNDGIIRAWMNGDNLVYERTDFRFRSKAHNHAGITRAYAAYIYWGGSWGAPQTQDVYFRDFAYAHGTATENNGNA